MDAQLIQETHTKMSTEELLDIISNPYRYTALAFQLANEELDLRNISQEERALYNQLQQKTTKLYPSFDIQSDLSFARKLYFFVLWLPGIWGSIRGDYTAKGALLKVRQSYYYEVLGFVSIMLVLALSTEAQTIVPVIILWGIFFLLSFAFDKYYNLQRQRRKLQKLSEEKKLELEW